MADSFKKVNRKVQEEPLAEIAPNPWHQKKREKVTQINVRIANKQMHDKHKAQFPFHRHEHSSKIVMTKI